MSLISNLKRDLINRKLYFSLVFIFISIYSVAVYDSMILIEDKAVINIVSLVTGSSAFLYLYIPILFFGINSHISNYEKEHFILKMKNRNNIFKNNIIFILAITTIISLIIVVLGFSVGSVYAGGFENLWPKNDPLYKLPKYTNINVLEILNSIPIAIVILKTFLIKFMGLFTISLLILIFKNVIHNSGILLISFLVFIFIDVNFLNGILFMNKLSLNIEFWISTGYFLMNTIYLIFLVIAFYLISKNIYKNKDFINKG